MPPIRLSSEARRETILAAAKACFARHGFAGTTTKSVAAAAGISEALLFKHFSSKSALYAEILDEACEADPELQRLQALPPSSETLVFLVREMVRHFLAAVEHPDEEDTQRMKLLISSHLEDGEFARLLYQKISDIIAPIFTASLDRAVQSGDAVSIGAPPMNLFWFAHQMIHMVALTRMPTIPSLTYGDPDSLRRQLCEFILRGLGLKERAIQTYLDRALPVDQATNQLVSESA
ncbi:TetR/AcrR family transcriptional regulator [Bradyrhizobium sp. U87765 SZCCT0131]|uniref:TetR/AcrR family transcriptional regulator n=1 Tax=unclassified Bradyrhizobium TaxID=2631580 RepID=UPI001BADFC4F|nr:MULTISPECIES: TetR/AcrR family transcriptional regulator [unclassified Bradyrhizobium]MBR1222731.1 TetR/AcrR family transcriptional regulator [Bradyrhizobium sp. U87765 SZCCT0131]MBR1265188.1 TetR/AcrR family transcriptional regulator [Bradyrhizobium sp. U87765 SZCCT0134]MBR1303033.1 TetR/AcrR family transcriptional regulator [Bradyrhizobium sp. U87765 SZCCT0110]MBR1323731.1 TetR/AcrR family transcriptional regulator [Bradyrhizobium sp. U87765 SZCCT0109]MBR1346962.1 TetR/AcrR family transcr